MTAAPTLIFDFDSTLVRIETLEALADIALEGHADAASVRARDRVADRSRHGRRSRFRRGAAAAARAAAPDPRPRSDRWPTASSTRARRRCGATCASSSDNAADIIILSGGFREIIAPVAERLGVSPDRVLCNDLIYDAEGVVTGVDDANPLSHENGKPTVIKALGLTGPVVMVGDGWNDAEVKLAGAADRFYAFTEIARRDKVVAVADAEAASIDELLHAEGLAGRWSYPRSRIRMLLLENIHPAAVERLEEAGYSVETLKGALDEDDLIEKIKGVHVLGIRSKTQRHRGACWRRPTVCWPSPPSASAPTRSISTPAPPRAWPCSTRPIPTPAAWSNWPSA